MGINSSPIIVTAPKGRLDAFSGAMLARSVRNRIGRDNANHVLDLRDLDELSHDTIRAIIKILRSVREAGGQVRLVVDDAVALSVLRLTALDRIFGVHPTLEAAITAFGTAELVSA